MSVTTICTAGETILGCTELCSADCAGTTGLARTLVLVLPRVLTAMSPVMVLAVMVMVMVLVMLGEVVVVTEEHWLAGNLESAELLVLMGKPEIEL